MSELPGAAQNGQNNEPTVSKIELDKVTAQNAVLSKDLESLKGQLLDQDYLQYLESKKAGRAPAARSVNAPDANSSISNLTLAQLQQVVASQIGQALETTMKPIYGRINELGAKQEVEDVKARYADFDQFKDQVVSILEGTPNTELTIEQAYKIAKGDAAQKSLDDAAAKAAKGEGKEAKGGNEKPGGTVPLEGESAQRHKDPKAAGTAAWNEVRGKYGLSGDTI